MRTAFARTGIVAAALACVAAGVPASGVHAAGEPYVVGVVVSESGPASTLGRPAADSVRMAFDEINAAGGIDGRRVDVKVIDDESVPAQAVNAVNQLIDQHPLAIIGSSGTPTSLAIVPAAMKAGIPLISLGSSAQIIEPAAERRWVFKVPVADTYIASRLLGAMRARKISRIAVVYRNDDYGKSGAARLRDEGKPMGIDVVDAEAIDATATDATTQLTHVRGANPQAVIVWTTLPSALVVLKGYRQLSLPYPLAYSEGSANPLFIEQAGSAADGVLFATEKANVVDAVPRSDPQKTVLMHYAAEFPKRYPKDGPPSIFGGFGYDAPYLLAEAARRAGGGGEKLRDALEHVRYTGVSGVFRLSPADHNGLGIDAVELVQAANGKFAVLR